MPITEYCDRNQLSPRQRLELFMQVCQAVQHAHKRASSTATSSRPMCWSSMHDGTPVVKVIDFGVAKATRPVADGQDAVHRVRPDLSARRCT